MEFYFRPKKSVIHEKFDDETVIVNLETGCYYSLQGSADAIWALAACGLSEAAIVARMGNAFAGEPDAIRGAVSDFVAQLVAEDLLERSADAPNAALPPLAGGVFMAPSLQKYTDMEALLQLDPIHEVDALGWPSAKPPVA